MKKILIVLFIFSTFLVAEDKRTYVKLPEMMQNHMMANMRDHLKALNEILISLENEEYDKAAQIAEERLGMTSLESHGASHMAQFMPKKMAEIGTSMHKAASRFALKAEEENALEAYKGLSKITTACVACHSSYKIK